MKHDNLYLTTMKIDMFNPILHGGDVNILHLAVFFISQKIFIGVLQFCLTFNIITFDIFWENLNAIGAKFEIFRHFLNARRRKTLF